MTDDLTHAPDPAETVDGTERKTYRAVSDYPPRSITRGDTRDLRVDDPLVRGGVLVEAEPAETKTPTAGIGGKPKSKK